jgi:hypothetical protein
MISENDSSSNQNINSVKNKIKFDEKFHIKLTENRSNCRDAKQSCKILQISSKLIIDDVISTLLSSEYPNLVIFIIECQNTISEESQKKIHEYLIKFDSDRPLILVQTYEDGNEEKYYFKAEKSNHFVDIDHNYSEDSRLSKKWLDDYNLELEPLEDKIFRKLSWMKNQSIFLRLLRATNLSEPYFGSMLLKVAENGSKTDLLAVLDASFEDNGRILSNQAQKYITTVFDSGESLDKADTDQNYSESGSDQSPDDDQGDLIYKISSEHEKQDTSRSFLLTAIQHTNKEIINLLDSFNPTTSIRATNKNINSCI